MGQDQAANVMHALVATHWAAVLNKSLQVHAGLASHSSETYLGRDPGEG